MWVMLSAISSECFGISGECSINGQRINTLCRGRTRTRQAQKDRLELGGGREGCRQRLPERGCRAGLGEGHPHPNFYSNSTQQD